MALPGKRGHHSLRARLVLHPPARKKRARCNGTHPLVRRAAPLVDGGIRSRIYKLACGCRKRRGGGSGPTRVLLFFWGRREGRWCIRVDGKKGTGTGTTAGFESCLRGRALHFVMQIHPSLCSIIAVAPPVTTPFLLHRFSCPGLSMGSHAAREQCGLVSPLRGLVGFCCEAEANDTIPGHSGHRFTGAVNCWYDYSCT